MRRRGRPTRWTIARSSQVWTVIGRQRTAQASGSGKMRDQGRSDGGPPSLKAPADLTVSVIVTCYNYGHFTQDCLESILGQTCPPSQVIVVDDGSTDATGRVLEGYGSRIELLRTDNRGQAAAFNVGFARSTGNIVIFVDADDLLRPDAIDVILYHWSDDLAVLTFGLETIDGAGHSTGVHAASIRSSAGDNRPELLSTDAFSSPPTSGNAFSRRLLERVLPMPEPRWRISADCYLIRAAALFGRADHVPQVLGSYRIHGGNNHAQALDAMPHLAREFANRTDTSDALFDLAEVAERFAEDPHEAEALRFLLGHRARKILEEAGATSRRPSRTYPPSEVSAGQEIRVDRSAVARLERSRWPKFLPFDRWTGVLRDRREALRPVPDLLDGTSSSRLSSLVEFRIDPSSEALLLALEIEPAAGADNGQSCAEVKLDGELVWHGQLSDAIRVRVPIAYDPWALDRCITVEVSTRVGAQRPADRQPPPPRILGLEVSTKGVNAPAPCLCTAGLLPFAEALAAGLDISEWETDNDGGATMRAESARMRFQVASSGKFAVVLSFGELPPRGWLQLRQDGRSLFSGWLGSTRSLVVRLPTNQVAVLSNDIEIGFEPATDAAGALLRIAEIGLLDLSPSVIDDRSISPILNLGECIFLGIEDSGRAFLGSGWDVEPELGGARNVLAEAQMSFCTPEMASDLVLRVCIEPLFGPLPGFRHFFAVSEDGNIHTAVQLDGAGEIEIALPRRSGRKPSNLVFHSVYVPETSGMSAAATVAAFVLTSMELRGREAIDAPPFLPKAQARPSPRFRSLIGQGKALLVSDRGAGGMVELSAICQELAEFIETCDAKALVLLVSEKGSLDVIVGLGHAVQNAEAVAFVSSVSWTGRPRDRPEASALRGWLLSFLFRPAYLALSPDLESLPAPLLWFPDGAAVYLGRAPDIHSAGARETYRAFLLRLLSSIDRVLARAPLESAIYALAARCLRELRSTVAIFGAGELRDLVRLRSRCIERLLVRHGAHLAMPRRRAPSSGKLRLGVLVRDVLPNPEGWALLGMYAGIDRSLFEPVLIRMDKGAGGVSVGKRFERELCLSGLSVGESVAAIRALQLDLFVTGCYVADYEKTSAIVAHRLAEVQIWHAAVCPTTGGFRSFDFALSCRATEPGEPQRHYVEQLAWIEGPLQSAYAFTEETPRRTAKLRQDLGIARDAVMLVSGAMAHKVEDRLLETWAAILRDAPASMLVLCPFASNWSMDFAPARFRDRLLRCLQAAGVSEERAVLLSTQTPKRVREIMANADLYLDSFPYTGATTVCEALSAGTPALTLAGDSLRELTGTSWIRAFGLPEMVAHTPDDYRFIAAGLANDRQKLRALRDRLGLALAAGPLAHNDPQRFGPEFSAALEKIAREAGWWTERVRNDERRATRE
ncbi:MAG: glycosyltransferase [Mesorhizobium sp.]|nr:MAG: glycosyltransferase [Mesorhizobium sp.]TJV47222.1 MAG: glycosyltransferase [Mesorhizobium sp.]